MGKKEGEGAQNGSDEPREGRREEARHKGG